MAKKNKNRSGMPSRRRSSESMGMFPGASPGYFNLTEESFPSVTVYSYSAERYTEVKLASSEELVLHLEKNKDLNHWVDITGYGNNTFIKNLQQYFKIHDLQMEDVLSLYQRPKVEEYDDHLFIISRMIYYNQRQLCINEQISLFVYNKIVLSLQDYEEDCLNPVRDRLRRDNSRLRAGSTFLLAYSIQDAIIDNYFPMLDDLAQRLEQMEEDILLNPGKEMLDELQHIKRILITLRKAIWPEKDKINELLRSNYKMVKHEYLIYLRDTYDHCVQIMDLIETQKEISHSIMDVYLSSVNNRLSEVMKVLTVISSIFIPLTFIVGVYGMNFSSVDKEGHPLPFNMPELYEPNGYLSVLALMLLIAILQIIYFKRRRWL